MDKRIHISRIWDIMNQRQSDGKPIEFSISFVKRSTGEIRVYDKAVLTSFHSSGTTVNILRHGETEPKKIRRCLVIKFNNVTVYY